MTYILGTMLLIAFISLVYSIYYDCVDKGKKARVYNELQVAKKKMEGANLIWSFFD